MILAMSFKRLYEEMSFHVRWCVYLGVNGVVDVCQDLLQWPKWHELYRRCNLGDQQELGGVKW